MATDTTTTESNEKLIKRLDKFYKRSASNKADLEDKWAELDEFYRGEQFNNNSNLPPWIPKPVTNFIHYITTTKRASLAGDNSTGMLMPKSQEDSGQVADLNQIYEWVWKQIKVRKVLREDILTSRLLGTGIAHMYWDEDAGIHGGTNTLYEGEIKVKEIDLMNFYPDPDAYCLEDCRAIQVVEKVPKKWVARKFGVNADDLEADPGAFGEKYKRIYASDTDSSMIDLHSHYEKYWKQETVTVTDPATGKNREEDASAWRYRCIYYAGDKILKFVDPLIPDCFPFAVLYDYEQRQNFWGLGTASLILDNQKLINKVESIIAMIGTQLQNPTKVVAKGSGINPAEAKKYGHAPGHTFVSNTDPASAIHWVTPPQIPQALITLAETAKQNIREITGVTEAYTGQSVGSVQTSGGINTLVDRSTLRDKDQMYDIELFVEQLSRLLIKFIVTKYSETRYIRIIDDPNNPQETMRFQPFVGRDYRELDYDFEVDVSQNAPITRARQAQEATTLLNIQGQYGFMPRVITPQEYIQWTNPVNKRDILKRMTNEESANTQQKLTQVVNMMYEGLQSGNVPPNEIVSIAEQQLQQIENGQIPVDPTMVKPSQNSTGSANTGSMQNRQAGLQ